MAGKDAGECSACRRPTVTAATGFSASNGSCHSNSGTVNSGRSPPLASTGPRHPTPQCTSTVGGSAWQARPGWAPETPGHHLGAILKVGISSASPDTGSPNPFVASSHQSIKTPGSCPFPRQPQATWKCCHSLCMPSGPVSGAAQALS